MPLHPMSLADVIAAVPVIPGISARTKANLASAVRCFCKVTGLDPRTTAAGDLGVLQERLASAHPARHGVTPHRWGVIRSQVLRALALTGAAKPLQTASTRLSPGWEELIAGLPKIRHRLALSRFARYCTQQGTAPGDVTQDSFDAFREALMASSLVRNPHRVCREAASAWNQIPTGPPGRHPAVQVSVPPTGTAKAPGRHPLAAFPASFREDLEAFQHWCATADPLDERARPKALRAQTVISYTSNLHSAADAAVRAGVPITDLAGLAVLTRPDVYLAILRQMLADAGKVATANLHGVATAVVILAQGWLGQSPDEIAALKALKAKLPKLRPGMTSKNRDLLAAFDDKAFLGRFLGLGDELWKEALSDRLPASQRLVRAQLALLIGILQITPLRRKNMCALVFDRHITWPNGPRAEALIHVPMTEHKTDRDYLGELPVALSRRLHHYRTKLAPELTGTAPSQLFIRADGRPKKQESVANRLEAMLEKRLGRRMSMHQFRHVCGKLLLDANPGAFEAAAQLLGHSGTKNVVKFYAGTDTRRASRWHAALVERLRDEARKRGPGRPKER